MPKFRKKPVEKPVEKLPPAARPSFESELAVLINRYCKENESNTPDFILANYLIASLAAFTAASRDRERWYGTELCIGGSHPLGSA